jgi:hypothetical protein
MKKINNKVVMLHPLGEHRRKKANKISNKRGVGWCIIWGV